MLSFGLKPISLQGNTDVNELIGSLPWSFQTGASIYQDKQEIEEEGNLRTQKDTQRGPGVYEKGWVRAEGGKQVGRILDPGVFS